MALRPAPRGGIAFGGTVRGRRRIQAVLRRYQAEVAQVLDNDVLGEFLVKRMKDRFRLGNARSKRAPDGTPWRPLSPHTKKKRRSRDDILRSSGDLMESIEIVRGNMAAAAFTNTGATLRIGSDLPYSGIHQRGGRSGRNNRVRIPARPYLGVSIADAEAARSLIIRRLRAVR